MKGVKRGNKCHHTIQMSIGSVPFQHKQSPAHRQIIQKQLQNDSNTAQNTRPVMVSNYSRACATQKITKHKHRRQINYKSARANENHSRSEHSATKKTTQCN